MLKAAVVGVGAMGKHHARIYHNLPGVDLVAVCDSDYGQAEEVALAWDTKPWGDLSSMLDVAQPDLVSIATPTSTHYGIAMLCLYTYTHVLIEKPIAEDSHLGRRLIKRSLATNTKIMVGHIERFNPAVQVAKRLLPEIGIIHHVSTRRCGPSPERIRDVGVTLDLATHDIDLMRYITQSDCTVAGAVLERRNHGRLEDAIAAILSFAAGPVGILQADWLTSAKIRDLTIVGRSGTIQVDLLNKAVILWKQPNEPTCIAVPDNEPLRLELESFVDAVRNDTEPPVTAQEGIAAVEVAQSILERGER